MAYLKEFLARIQKIDWRGFWDLWLEYSAGDEIDTEELLKILLAIKGSGLEKNFGKEIQSALDLFKKVENQPKSEAVFAAIIDLQTLNTPELADQVTFFLEERYGNEPHYLEKLKLVGLKSRTNFQGAVSGFLLLNHLHKGKSVFHTGGWGVGEVMNVSMLREQVELEFEKVSGKRDLPFSVACKVLIPLSDDHFLARRFISPDLLEKQAKEDPVSVIMLLLKDLGSKTAAEIKEELVDLVIPAADWNKWWQSAKTKLKKEEHLEVPEDAKLPFSLQSEKRTLDKKVVEILDKARGSKAFIEALYTNVRDHGELFREEELRRHVLEKIKHVEDNFKLTPSEKLELFFLREDLHDQIGKSLSHKELEEAADIVHLIEEMTILAFKKRAVQELKMIRSDWEECYAKLLTAQMPSTVREALLKEEVTKRKLESVIEAYLERPETQPEFVVWYLPRALADKSLPLSDKKGQCRLLEAFLMLLSRIEQKPPYRDLVKKMQGQLTTDRFLLVRSILDGCTKDFASEFILLASKCNSLVESDVKTLHSLAFVVYPELNKDKKSRADEEDESLVWTTEVGLKKLQERIKQIGTVETIENAREIEAARALGDLRENSEFKFALEKRARLQTELKTLSDQLHQMKIITKDDVPQGKVGIGSIVTLEKESGEKVTYTLLGPLDADTEKNILAFQSKLAQSMVGLKIGDKFSFQKDHYLVTAIESYL